jgi:RNA polymerase sigma factor (sigma-70 family)
MGTGKFSRVQESPINGWHEEEKATDGQLLEQFVANRDEAAFADLVRRYGSLVLGVCRRVLGDTHQAEDAFQTTFLVLVRRANSLDGREPLGNWLYAVAYRTATKARMIAARRRARERQAMGLTSEAYLVDEEAWDELRPILDEELSQLPRKYRAPLILCYLEGKTQQQAAQELGWPSGSMSRRMDRARQLLRARLEKRGVAHSVGMGFLFWLLSQKATATVVSPALVMATVKAALALGIVEGIISGSKSGAEIAGSQGSGAGPGDSITPKESFEKRPSSSNSKASHGAKALRKKVAYLALATIVLLGLASFVWAAWVYEYAESRGTSVEPKASEVEVDSVKEEQAAILVPGPAPPAFTPCHSK